MSAASRASRVRRVPAPGAGNAPRERGGVSWFSAVVLFMLLSASSDPTSSVAAAAHHRVEIRSEWTAHELPGAPLVALNPVPYCELVAPMRLARALPWSRSVIEHGLPQPRAPTA